MSNMNYQIISEMSNFKALTNRPNKKNHFNFNRCIETSYSGNINGLMKESTIREFISMYVEATARHVMSVSNIHTMPKVQKASDEMGENAESFKFLSYI